MLWSKLILALFVGGEATAPAPGRPACRAETRGMFWPLEANENPRLISRFSREGRLELCTRGAWRYSWKQLSVRVTGGRGAVETAKGASAGSAARGNTIRSEVE